MKRFLFFCSANLENTISVSGRELITNSEEKNKVYSVEINKDDYNVKIIYHPGSLPSVINFNNVRSEALAGSSVNLAHHFSVIYDSTDITVAIPIADDLVGKRLSTLLEKETCNTIYVKSDVSANTVVFVHKASSKTVLYMQKPNHYYPNLNDFKKNWDIIAATSLPRDISVLKMVLKVLKESPETLKAVIPSMDLLEDKNEEIQKIFFEILELTNIFQVNTREAREFLEIGHGVALSGKDLINRMVLHSNLRNMSIIIVTMGKEGSVVASKLEDFWNFFYVKSYKAHRVKSTIGCGDAYCSWFLIKLFETGGLKSSLKDFKKALIWASRMGSLVSEVYPGNLKGTDREFKEEFKQGKLLEIAAEVDSLIEIGFVSSL